MEPMWSDRDAKSGAQRSGGRRVTNLLRHEAAALTVNSRKIVVKPDFINTVSLLKRKIKLKCTIKTAVKVQLVTGVF